jgi:hypothetical protein
MAGSSFSWFALGGTQIEVGLGGLGLESLASGYGKPILSRTVFLTAARALTGTSSAAVGATTSHAS